MLACFSHVTCSTFASCKTNEICDYILQHPEYQNIGLLFSGDTGFYSGAKSFTNQFKQREQGQEYEIKHICGISSLSYFCAKLQIPWDDIAIISLHGRETPWISTVRTNPKTFLLTGGAYSVENICKELCAYQMQDTTVYVGSNLSYENESIVSGTAEALAKQSFPFPNCNWNLMILCTTLAQVPVPLRLKLHCKFHTAVYMRLKRILKHLPCWSKTKPNWALTV